MSGFSHFCESAQSLRKGIAEAGLPPVIDVENKADSLCA
jgi:hypothetical protein